MNPKVIIAFAFMPYAVAQGDVDSQIAAAMDLSKEAYWPDVDVAAQAPPPIAQTQVPAAAPPVGFPMAPLKEFVAGVGAQGTYDALGKFDESDDDDKNESGIPHEWWRDPGDRPGNMGECPLVALRDAVHLEIKDGCKTMEPKVELVATISTREGSGQVFWGEWEYDGKSLCYDSTVRTLNLHKFQDGAYVKDCKSDRDCDHGYDGCTLECGHDYKCAPAQKTIERCMTFVGHFDISLEELKEKCADLPWTKEEGYHKEYHHMHGEDPNAACMEYRHMWNESDCHVLEGDSMQCGHSHMTGVKEACDEDKCKAVVRLSEDKTCAAYCEKHHMSCEKACQAGEHEGCPAEFYTENWGCDHWFESEHAVCQCVPPQDDMVVLDPREKIWPKVDECMGYLKRYTKCVREEYCSKDPNCGDMLPDEGFYKIMSKWANIKPPKCISIPTATARRLNAVFCPWQKKQEHGDEHEPMPKHQDEGPWQKKQEHGGEYKPTTTTHGGEYKPTTTTHNPMPKRSEESPVLGR